MSRSRRRSRPSRRRARRQAADRLFQGDGAHHPHPPRRRDLRHRRILGRAGSALRRPRGLAGRARRGPAESDAPAAEGAPTAPAPAPREPRAAPQGATPADLAAARLNEARAPIDRSPYKTVRSAAELGGWIARAREEGLVAIDAETSSPDPLQGELIGLSLAVRPGEACYIPIGSPGERRRSLRRRRPRAKPDQGSRRNRTSETASRGAGSPQDGHDLKFDMHVFATRGVRMKPIDDAMLLSYALDAGATGDDHSLDTLSHASLATSCFRSAKSPARAAISWGLRARRSTGRASTARKRLTSPCGFSAS